MPKEVNFGTLTDPRQQISVPVGLLNSGSTPMTVIDISMQAPTISPLPRYPLFGASGPPPSSSNKRAPPAPPMSPPAALWWYEKDTALAQQQGHLEPVDLLTPEPASLTLGKGQEEPHAMSLLMRGTQDGIFSGGVVVLTNDTNPATARFEVAYTGRVIFGVIGYDPEAATFAITNVEDCSEEARREARDRAKAASDDEEEQQRRRQGKDGGSGSHAASSADASAAAAATDASDANDASTANTVDDNSTDSTNTNTNTGGATKAAPKKKKKKKKKADLCLGGCCSRTRKRDIHLTNHFRIPVTMENVLIQDPNFDVLDFPSGHTALPGQPWGQPVVVSFRPNASIHSYSVNLIVETNVTTFAIPLHVYHGILQVDGRPETYLPGHGLVASAITQIHGDTDAAGVAGAAAGADGADGATVDADADAAVSGQGGPGALSEGYDGWGGGYPVRWPSVSRAPTVSDEDKERERKARDSGVEGGRGADPLSEAVMGGAQIGEDAASVVHPYHLQDDSASASPSPNSASSSSSSSSSSSASASNKKKKRNNKNNKNSNDENGDTNAGDEWDSVLNSFTAIPGINQDTSVESAIPPTADGTVAFGALAGGAVREVVRQRKDGTRDIEMSREEQRGNRGTENRRLRCTDPVLRKRMKGDETR